MADFRARQRVQIHDGTNEFGVATAQPLLVRLTDGTDLSLVDAAGNLNVILAANSGVDIGDVDVTSVPAPLNVVGGGTEAAALRVTLANDSTGLISVDDNGSSLTIDGTVTLLANSGVDIGDVDVTSVIPGVGATNLGKAEDAVHATGDTGVQVLAVRNDTLASLVSADGDYAPLQVDADGALYVSGTFTAANVLVDDAAFTVGTSSVGAIGFLADETAPDSVDEGDIGAARMTLDRKQLMVIADATTDSQRLGIDASGHAQVDIAAVSVTAVPVSATAAANTETNPLFVQVVTGAVSGVEQCNYDTAAAVAKDATDNHDITVTGGKTFLIKSIIMASSGAMKGELQVGPVAGLATKAVFFTSGAKPTEQIVFDPPIEVPDTSTGTIRLIRRNDDHQAMDVYRTIIGVEI